MLLIEDKGNKENLHIVKNRYWSEQGVEVQRHPLPVGDYVLANDLVLDVINRKTKRGMETKKMDFLGTYSVAVDTKRDMMEIYGNLVGSQHERFRDELILAQNNGIKLFILVENMDGIKEVRDVFRWQNPRIHRYNKIKYCHSIGRMLDVPLPSKPPVKGEQLAKVMLTMEKKYGCSFVFCTPQKAGEKVIELLTAEGEIQDGI